MRLKMLCVGAGLCLASWTWAQSTDKPLLRIGVSKMASHAALDADERGFEDALASAGFKEGVNITYDRQNALGDLAKAKAIAQRFAQSKVHLVHSIATGSTQAVIKELPGTPVVFSSVTDPVAAGIVPSGSTPGSKTGTMVTGVSDTWPVRLQMETYKQFVPRETQWGTIYNPKEVNSVVHVKAMRAAARELGIDLMEVTIDRSEQVEAAAKSLVGRVKVIAITSDNTTVSNLEALAKVCEQHKIALFAGDVDSVARGAVAAYGMDYYLVGYAAGKKAALVLKGIKPGSIPWGPVEKFSLVINRSAAKAQGVQIPAQLLAKADKVLP